MTELTRFDRAVIHDMTMTYTWLCHGQRRVEISVMDAYVVVPCRRIMCCEKANGVYVQNPTDLVAVEPQARTCWRARCTDGHACSCEYSHGCLLQYTSVRETIVPNFVAVRFRGRRAARGVTSEPVER